MLKHNNKGFGMIFFVLVTFVIILTCLIGFTFFKFMLNMVDESSKGGEKTIENYPDSFRIDRIRFYEENITQKLEMMANSSVMMNLTDCTVLEKLVIIDILFNSSKTPKVCEIKFNGNLEKIIPIDVNYTTNHNEIVIPIPIKKKFSNQNHIIETCCDEICSKNVLEAIC